MLVECAAMVRSDAAVAADHWIHAVSSRLHSLSANYSVGVTASFAEHLSDEETDSLFATVDAAAAFVSKGGVMPAIRAEGATVGLSVNDGVSITGPSENVDHAAKLRSLLIEKAEQTHGSVPTWLCVHSLDGLFWGAEWARVALDTKLRALSEIVTDSLVSYPHVAGAVISNGAGLVDIRQGTNEAMLNTGATAVQQPVPPLKHREGYVIPTTADALGTSFFTSAYRGESSWFDWALAREDLPSTKAIFAP
jgi:hypothetical protein